jgi:predicted Zn-dependent protease with MMP-like domain
MLPIMMHVTDELFQKLVEEAVASIPKRFADHLDNVAFIVADRPSSAQLQSNGILHGNMTLLGLYEGIPLPRRGNGYNGVAPDVITIFRGPHEAVSQDMEGMRRAVHQTVWHEVAHYFGLGHGAISELEDRG